MNSVRYGNYYLKAQLEDHFQQTEAESNEGDFEPLSLYCSTF